MTCSLLEPTTVRDREEVYQYQGVYMVSAHLLQVPYQVLTMLQPTPKTLLLLNYSGSLLTTH